MLKVALGLLLIVVAVECGNCPHSISKRQLRQAAAGRLLPPPPNGGNIRPPPPPNGGNIRPPPPG